MQAGSPFVRKTEIRSFNCRLLFTQSKRPEEAHLLPTGNGGSVYCSHIKPVVGFAAVQADLFAAHHANPIGPGLLAAAFAGVGIEQLCLGGERNGGFLYIEHVFGLQALEIGKGFGSGHTFGSGLQHQANGFTGFAVVKREGLLAPHVEQQIALADAAAQNHLDGITAAGIILGHTHHLLVIGEG